VFSLALLAVLAVFVMVTDHEVDSTTIMEIAPPQPHAEGKHPTIVTTQPRPTKALLPEAKTTTAAVAVHVASSDQSYVVRAMRRLTRQARRLTKKQRAAREDKLITEMRKLSPGSYTRALASTSHLGSIAMAKLLRRESASTAQRGATALKQVLKRHKIMDQHHRVDIPVLREAMKGRRHPSKQHGLHSLKRIKTTWDKRHLRRQRVRAALNGHEHVMSRPKASKKAFLKEAAALSVTKSTATVEKAPPAPSTASSRVKKEVTIQTAQPQELRNRLAATQGRVSASRPAEPPAFKKKSLAALRRLAQAKRARAAALADQAASAEKEIAAREAAAKEKQEVDRAVASNGMGLTELDDEAKSVATDLEPRLEAKLELALEAKLGPKLEAKLEAEVEAKVESKLEAKLEAEATKLGREEALDMRLLS
jgi:hypothetical protein